MNEILKVMIYFLSLMTLVYSSYSPILGPPRVILNCSADYLTQRKTIELSWKPSLIRNDTSITSERVGKHFQNCIFRINCSNGYTTSTNCRYSGNKDSYSKEKFQEVPLSEVLCMVEVETIDYYDFSGGEPPKTRKTCSYSDPISTVSMQGTTDSVIIGRPYSLECIVNMRQEVNTNIVKIDWNGPLGSITNDSRTAIHPIVSNDTIIFNSTLQFLNLSPNDTGTFTCNVTILKFDIPQSQTYQLDNITVPNLTISMQGSTGSATVGQHFSIECSIQISGKLDSSIVKIDWTGPNGPITNDSGISIHPSTSNDGITHNSTLQFLCLSQNDSGSFNCSVTILGITRLQTYQLDNITIPTPNVSITNQTFNNSVSLECIITTVKGISVDIVWKVNETEIRRTNNSLGNAVNNLTIHKDVYNISNVGDEGTEYYCHAMINESSVANDSFIFTGIKTPSPTIIVTSTFGIVSASSMDTTNIPSPMDDNDHNRAVITDDNDHYRAVIIYLAAISFLFISLLTGVFICMFIRQSYLKRTRSTDNDVQFKASTIFTFDETLAGRDDASTCENIDVSDKVDTWIKTSQGPSLDEHYDDDNPSNEEILNCVCGQSVKCYDPRQSNEKSESKELSKTEENLCSLANNSIGEEPVDPMISYNYHGIESFLQLEEQTLEGDTVQTFDKDSSQSIQAEANNTEVDHSLSTVEPETIPNGTVSPCNNVNTVNIEVVACFGQVSLNSNDKSTEDASLSSISSYSVNVSLVEGEYIETKSSTYNAMEDIICIPMQSYNNSHQNAVAHSDDETHSPISGIEGEYVDRNIAVQENECITE